VAPAQTVVDAAADIWTGVTRRRTTPSVMEQNVVLPEVPQLVAAAVIA
jgi:hypothetical protein